MAYGRYRRRTSRRPSRRYGKRKGYRRSRSTRSIATRALRTAAKVSRVMRKELNHYHDGGDHVFPIPGSTDPTVHEQLLNAVENGTGEYARIGNDFTMKSLSVRMDFSMATSPEGIDWYRRCRILLIRRKTQEIPATGTIGPNNQTVAWDKVLDSVERDPTGGGLVVTNWGPIDADKCFYNPTFVPSMFEILGDKLVKIDAMHPQQQVQFNVRVPYTVKCYDQTAFTDIYWTNQILLLAIPLDKLYTVAEGQMKFNWGSRLTYYEN